MDDGRGQGQALLQAQGQGAGQVVAALLQVHQAQDLGDPLPEPVGGQAVDPAEEVQVFLGGQVLIEGEALGHVADVLFDPVVFPDDVEAAHPALAAGGQQQAVQHADGGGFARAVGPQKAEDLPPLHLEADVVHRLKSPEMAGEILDDYGRFGWHLEGFLTIIP